MENNRTKLTHSLTAKIAAVFLLVIFAVCALGFTGIIVLDITENAYAADYAPPQSYNAALDGLMRFCYAARYWGAALGALGYLGFAAALVFLCCAAGHRGKTEEIYLSTLDRLPLDLYWLAAGGAAALLLSLGVRVGNSTTTEQLAGVPLLAVLVLLACLLALAAFLTLVKRLKYGGRWWRNTVIWWACSVLWKGLCAAWRGLGRAASAISRGLPIVWRTALIAAGAILVELILTYCLFSQSSLSTGFGGALWFLYNLAIYAALLYGAFQLKKLRESGKKLAAGDFAYRLDTSRMYWEFKSHGDDLNRAAGGLAAAVDERLKSERLKTELITNVSHDIKTPLTSIVNYVDLLQKPHTETQGAEYLAVLARQSQRLKKLTEDLVEASKASTGSLSVSLAPVNTRELISQALAEYAEKLAAGKLEPVVSIPEPAPSVTADGRLLWRVLDNLLSNVCKYALPGTRVYLDAAPEGDSILISVKNISRAPLNLSAEELTERFVRGDASRSTEGSGLGLNIAQSLMALQKGTLALSTDGDLFKAALRLPRA